MFTSDEQEIRTESKQVAVLAKGDVLHKIKRFYSDMRKILKKNITQLEKAIEISDDERIHKLLPDQVFIFLQPGFVLGNPDFPGYDCAYRVWTAAVENNLSAIITLKEKGMSDQFMAFCKEHHHD